jgi:isorenieratene synthase
MHFPTGVATAVARIWFDRRPEKVSEAGIFSGDFIVDNFFWLEQLQPAYRQWHQATGGSAIETHIYGPPELLDQPDTALLAQVVQDIHRAFPELRGQRRHIVLQRNPATHTLFSLGEPGRHLGTCTPWPDLFACGDWTAHPAPALYLERAAITGIAAANAVLAGRNLEPWPLLEYPAPEAVAAFVGRQWWRFRQARLRRRRKA